MAVSEARRVRESEQRAAPGALAARGLGPAVAGLVWLWNAPGHGILGLPVRGAARLSAARLGRRDAALSRATLRISQFAALGGVLGALLGAARRSCSTASSAGSRSARSRRPASSRPAGTRCASSRTPRRCRRRRRRSRSRPRSPATRRSCRPCRSASAIPTGDDLARIRARDRGGARALRGRGLAREARRLPRDAAAAHRRAARRRAHARHRLRASALRERLRAARRRARPRALARVPRQPRPRTPGWCAARPTRPWLVCIHGYQMGRPLIDLSAFRPEWLARQHGLNLLLPVLPLHGPRTRGRRSGDGYLAGDILDTIHAQAQAMWDMRRLLSLAARRGRDRDRRLRPLARRLQRVAARRARARSRLRRRGHPGRRLHAPLLPARPADAAARGGAARHRGAPHGRDPARGLAAGAAAARAARAPLHLRGGRRPPGAGRPGARPVAPLGAAAHRVVPGRARHLPAPLRACAR